MDWIPNEKIMLLRALCHRRTQSMGMIAPPCKLLPPDFFFGTAFATFAFVPFLAGALTGEATAFFPDDRVALAIVVLTLRRREIMH